MPVRTPEADLDAFGPPEERGDSSFTVQEMDPQADVRWEAFVAEHPLGTVYHHPAWLRTLSAEYPQRSVHLACIGDQGQLLGILPLLHTRGLPLLGNHLVGRRLSSLPRTPTAGPLTTGPSVTTALLQEAVARVRTEPGLRLQVKVREPDENAAESALQTALWRTNYVLELPERHEEVRFGGSRNHTRIKSAVKRARTVGVAVREAERLHDLEAWYRLYVETVRSHLVPPRPARLFTAMWEILRERGMMRLLLAYKEEPGREPVLVAGSLLLMWGDTVFYAFNGRDPNYLWMGANDVLQWEAIHQAAAEGYRYYDLGEVAPDNPGLARFKKKWGAEPRDLYRYYYPPIKIAGASASERAQLARRLLHHGWRRLPHPLTTAVGEQVYKYL